MIDSSNLTAHLHQAKAAVKTNLQPSYCEIKLVILSHISCVFAIDENVIRSSRGVVTE